MNARRLALGQQVIIWDGQHAVPAVVIVNSTADTQEWAPVTGESVSVLTPDTAQHITRVDVSLCGDFRIRSTIDDMEDLQ